MGKRRCLLFLFRDNKRFLCEQTALSSDSFLSLFTVQTFETSQCTFPEIISFIPYEIPDKYFICLSQNGFYPFAPTRISITRSYSQIIYILAHFFLGKSFFITKKIVVTFTSIFCMNASALIFGWNKNEIPSFFFLFGLDTMIDAPFISLRCNLLSTYFFLSTSSLLINKIWPQLSHQRSTGSSKILCDVASSQLLACFIIFSFSRLCNFTISQL